MLSLEWVITFFLLVEEEEDDEETLGIPIYTFETINFFL